MQGVIGSCAKVVERGGGIDIPEQANCIRARSGSGCGKQKIVEDADAAGFDDDIGLGCSGGNAVGIGLRSGVDNRGGPFGRIDVAMVLTIERIGFVESDRPATPREIGQDPEP